MTSARQILHQLNARSLESDLYGEDYLSLSHGFLPRVPPRLSLSPSHQALDEVAAQMPELLADGRLRAAIERLPPLSMEQQSLPAEDLSRAATIVGLLTHGYVTESFSSRPPLSGNDAIFRYAPEAETTDLLPAWLFEAWKQLGKRLQRKETSLSFSDLVINNWKFRNPQLEQPWTIENLDLLVPYTGTAEERIFYMTFIETMAETIPLTGLVVDAQEAAVAQQWERVKSMLLRMAKILRHISFNTLNKIAPNPLTSTHTDPLIWTAFVAPLSMPIRKGELGLSGAGIPFVHLMDIFLGRKSRDSKIGRGVKTAYQHLPKQQQNFFRALSQISMTSLIDQSGDDELQGVFAQVFEGYAGKRGWLGVHRIKVFGFMEVGFKAGRSQTNGGFSGKLEERAWDHLDDDLNDARHERLVTPPRYSLAKVSQVIPVDSLSTHEYYQVIVDISGLGLEYRAGDLCAVLTRNSKGMVEKTLDVLQATGQEMVGLNTRWIQYLSGFMKVPPKTLPLQELLFLGELRPLSQAVAYRLYRLTLSERIWQVIEKQAEDQLEFWEALTLVDQDQYDVRRMWRAKPWEAESILRFVLPNRVRFYSVSSSPDLMRDNQWIELTIKQLKYKKEKDGSLSKVFRKGVASNFLTSTENLTVRNVPISIVRLSRFHLPKSHATPIIMMAGGSGLAPFRSFWQQRMKGEKVGENWLILGSRTPRSILYFDELHDMVKKGIMRVDVQCSQENTGLRTQTSKQGAQLASVPISASYVDMLLNEPPIAEKIWSYMTDTKHGACFYICGQSRFAHTVIEGLKKIIETYKSRHEVLCQQSTHRIFCGLVAENRVMMDIFSSSMPKNQSGVLANQEFHISQVVAHNNEQRGYWMILQGQVYDIGAYLLMHPGGDRILKLNAGLDATRSYEKVEHHLNPDIHSMLDLFKIGSIRQIHFANRWGIALTRDGPKTFFLHQVYLLWVQYLFMVVEQENVLRSNASLRNITSMRSETLNQPTRLKAHVLLEQRARFDVKIIDLLLGDWLLDLWHISIGMFDKSQSMSHLPDQIQQVRSSVLARTTLVLQEHCQTLLESLDEEEPEGFSKKLHATHALIQKMENCSLQFLGELKANLQMGLQCFEYNEEQVMQEGGTVVDTLLLIPSVLSAYYHRLRVLSDERESLS